MLNCCPDEVPHTPLAQFSADSLVTAFGSTVGSSNPNVPWERREIDSRPVRATFLGAKLNNEMHRAGAV